MASVDEKVVSLEFDNKQFENAVSQTLQSLENLKSSLNFKGVGQNVASSLGQVQQSVNNVDFSKISQGIDQLNDRFSTLGIVGATAIAKITNAAMNFATGTWNNTIGQIMSGGRRRAQNLEMANFQLAGLGFKGKELANLQRDAMDAVAGTAYGLDEASKVASQLAASGVKTAAKDMTSDMYQALRAIAGVASMTGAEYSRIGDIFTTVAGNGKVMSMQLMQMSTAGLNGAAALAEYLTKVGKGAKVTEADVREMVSKGKIDFATFSKAMTDKFGEAAGKANETYSGALANMKAALSRIGADFYTPYLTNMRDIFNSLRVFIDQVHEALKPFITVLNEVQNALAKVFVKFAELGGLMTLFNAVKIAFDDIGKVIEKFGVAFDKVFGSKTTDQVANTLNIISNGFKTLIGQFQLSYEALDNALYPFFLNMFRTVKTLMDTFGPAVQVIFGLLVQAASRAVWVFERFFGGMLDGMTKVSKSISDFFSSISKSKNMSTFIDNLGKVFSKLADVAYRVFYLLYRIMTTIKWTVFQVAIGIIENLRDMILDFSRVLPKSISGISSFIKSFLGLKESQSLLDFVLDRLSAFEVYLNHLNKVILRFYRNNIQTFSENLKAWRESKETMAVFADIGESLVDIFSALWGVITDVASVVGNILSSAFSGITSSFGKFNKEVKGSKNNFSVFTILTEILKGVSAALKVVSSVVQAFVSTLRDLGSFIFENFGPAAEVVTGFFSSIFEAISENTIFQDFQTSFGNFIATITGADSFQNTGLFKIFDTIKNFFSGIVSSKTIPQAISKIQSFFGSLRDIIGERAIAIFSNLGNAISNLFGIIQSLFSELMNRPEVQSFIDTVKEGLTGLFEFMGEAFTTGIEAVTDFIQSLQGMDSISFANILNALVGFKDNLADFLDLEGKIDAFKNFFEGFLKFIFGTENAYGDELGSEGLISDNVVDAWSKSLDVAEASNGIFDRFLSVIDGIKKNVFQIAKRIKAADMMALVVSGSMIKFTHDIGGIGESFKGALDSLSGYLDSIKKKKPTKTENFKEIIKSMIALIVVVAAALFILSNIDTGQLIVAAGVLTGVVTVISVLVGALMIIESKTKGMENAGAIATSFVGIAASILIIVVALKMLEGVDLTPEFAIKLGIIAGIFVALGALTIAMGRCKIDPKAFANAALITGFASSILVVVAALRLLQTLPLEGLAPRLAILAGIFVALGGLVIAVGKLNLNARAIVAMSSISKMAAALLIVVVALWMLNFVEIDPSLIGKMAVIAATLGMFALLVKIISAAKPDPAALKNLASLKAVALALLMVVGAIAILSLMDAGGMVKAMGIITWITALFAGIIAVTKFSNEADKAARLLLTMSISLTVMVGALAILNNMDAGRLQTSVEVIAILSLCMIGIMAVSKYTMGAEKTILTISVTLVALTGCLGILASMNPSGVLSSAISLSVLLGVLTVCMVILANIKAEASKMMTAAVSIAILSSTLLVIGGVLAIISGMNISGDISTTISMISGMLLEFTGIFAALAALGPLINLSGGAAGMIAIAAGFAAAVDVIIVIIGALIGLVGWINQLTEGDLVNKINEGAEVLSAIGSAIGGFIGGIIGGVAGGIDAALGAMENIGTHLSNFIDNLTPFLDGASNINPGVLSSIDILTSAILKLTASSILDGIASFIKGDSDLGDFGEKIATLCNSVVEAASEISELSDADAKKFETLAKVIGPFIDISHSLEGTGGLLQDIIGEKDLGNFGNTLSALCTAFSSASDNIGDLPMEELATKFEQLRNIVQPFIDVANSLNGTGGLLQDIVGEQDLGEFGNTLTALVKAFAQASKAFGSLNMEELPAKFNSLKDIITPFVEMTNSLEASGGALQFWAGDKNQSLEDFGTSFQNFINSFVTASKALDDSVGFSNFQNVTDLLKSLLDMSSMVQEGSANVTNLATLFYNLKDAINDFSNGLNNTNMEDVGPKVKAFIQGVMDAVNSIETEFDASKASAIVENVKSMVSAINDAFSSASFDANIASDSMNTLLEAIGIVINDKKAELIDKANSLRDELKSILESIGSSQTIGSMASQIDRVMNTVRSTSESKFSAIKPVYRSAGQGLAEEFNSGLGDGSILEAIYAAGEALANRAYEGASTMKDKFYSIGNYCAQGIVNGARGGGGGVYSAFYSLGRQAVDAFKAATKQASPSKEFIKASDYNIQGIVKGVDMYGRKVDKAYYQLGEGTVDSFQSAMSGTSLTPVLDFNSTDISALQAISSGNYRIGADVNTRFLNRDIESLAQTMTKNTRRSNREVVNAVDGLRDIIRDSVGDTIINGDFTNDANVMRYMNQLVTAITLESRM